MPLQAPVPGALLSATATARADPTPTTPPADGTAQLESMGFTRALAAAALAATGNDVARAADWILSRAAELGTADAEATSEVVRLTSKLGLTSAREHWASQGKEGLEATKLFIVAPASVEHAAIAAEFAKTLPGATVDRLERVENGFLHESFELQAAAVEHSIGASYRAGDMRQFLFHGTDAVEVRALATRARARRHACQFALLGGWKWGERLGVVCFAAPTPPWL